MAFCARVFETARHKRELSALRRIQTRMTASTSWGPSQLATVYAEGIVSHTTAGHCGFHLSGERNLRVSPLLRKSSPWYEEDAEWAIVAITFTDTGGASDQLFGLFPIVNRRFSPRLRNLKDRKFHTFEKADSYPVLAKHIGAPINPILSWSTGTISCGWACRSPRAPSHHRRSSNGAPRPRNPVILPKRYAKSAASSEPCS